MASCRNRRMSMVVNVAVVSILLTMATMSSATSANYRPEAQREQYRRPYAQREQLSSDYYNKLCPGAFDVIKNGVKDAVNRERRMAASLIRLHFHDCFVLGCDASILLDDDARAPEIQSEKEAGPNVNSVRGYEVIDTIKAEVERVCPETFSCADLLTVAARDASAYVGGPDWPVQLGRKDSTTASRTSAVSDLPSFRSTLDQLIENFRKKDLNERDLVALSGAHTIGKARCSSFRDRIYNDTRNIDENFARTRQQQCSSTGTSDGGNLAPLDVATPDDFDNYYFVDLVQRKGLLTSDQALYNGGSTDQIVVEYANNPRNFYGDFASAMQKMGTIGIITGSDEGEIRKNCRVRN